MAKVLYLVVCSILVHMSSAKYVDKRKCPEVRAVPHFDLPRMLGDWFVVEYYASAEEALSYSCMRAVFTEDDHVPTADGSIEFTPGVTMNFTYRFADDPLGENLLGNITWRVDLNEPAHWTHAEKTYDGIYNTYVLDTEYKTWALLLHCAEQTEGARYLSAFVLSRTTALPKNVMAYLRDKLPSPSSAPDFGVKFSAKTTMSQLQPPPRSVPETTWMISVPTVLQLDDPDLRLQGCHQCLLMYGCQVLQECRQVVQEIRDLLIIS